MSKKYLKVIQKDILGRLGRLFSTHAGIEREQYDKERDRKSVV